MSALVLALGFGMMASGAWAAEETAGRWGAVQLAGFVIVLVAIVWTAGTS